MASRDDSQPARYPPWLTNVGLQILATVVGNVISVGVLYTLGVLAGVIQNQLWGRPPPGPTR
jgi:hypothetical protein